MSYPGNLHQDGYRIERRELEDVVEIYAVFRLNNEEVSRLLLLSLSRDDRYLSLLPFIESSYTASARYFQLVNESRPEFVNHWSALVDGFENLAKFCTRTHPFAIADWDYVTSRAEDDHIYKHKTENRFLRVVENQWTEPLTAEEVERMLARDQADDQDGWSQMES